MALLIAATLTQGIGSVSAVAAQPTTTQGAIDEKEEKELLKKTIEQSKEITRKFGGDFNINNECNLNKQEWRRI